MFPIIPYNYNTSSRSSSYFDNNFILHIPKVFAICDITENTKSKPIDLKLLTTKQDKFEQQLEIGLDTEGYLAVQVENKFSNAANHWFQAIRLSDDCHSYNTKLCLDRSSESNTSLIVEITRPIKAGHELQLWFSEDILAILQMAFLTPTNIQGQKCYVCNLCSTTFEYPNPLKLHITLNCGKHKISILWERLYSSLTNNLKSIDVLPTNSLFKFELNNKQNIKILPTKNAIFNLSISETSRIDKKSWLGNISPTFPIRNEIAENNSSPIPRPFSEPLIHSSAFKPYPSTFNKYSRNNNSLQFSQSLNTSLTSLSINSEPNLLTTNETITNYSRMVDFRHAAEMETIVSNLGKSKQGHLCIYCGKCYSRKYGLKIHIRTHTGYKPLKCKFCLRPFGDPSNLNKHVRLHAEGDTPYKCELCGKVLVRRRDLERHLKSRHMEDINLEDKIEEISSSSDHSDN